MKQFILKIKDTIIAFFSKIRQAISNGWRSLKDTKPMRTVSQGVSYIPNKMADLLPHRTRKIIWGVVFLLPLVIGLIYFFLAPLFISLQYSFSFVENINGVGVQTTNIGWKNFIFVFTEASTTTDTFSELLVLTVIDIVSDVPIILIFSLLIAVVLNSKFKGRALVRAIFFMPVIFNSQAIDIIMVHSSQIDATIAETTNQLFAQMFNFQDFLANANLPIGFVSFLGGASDKIYEIISYSGVQILIFLSAIQSVPKHLYEAAQMEGATKYEMFWKITWPMVSPMMLPVVVYTVVDSFLTSPLLGIIRTYSISTGKTTSAALGTISDYGIGAAMSWIFAIVGLIVVSIFGFIISRMVFYYDE